MYKRDNVLEKIVQFIDKPLIKLITGMRSNEGINRHYLPDWLLGWDPYFGKFGTLSEP